jgi:alpha/beta superfamily hydrolase
VIPGASHFFNEHLDTLAETVDQYLVTAIPEAAAKARASR